MHNGGLIGISVAVAMAAVGLLAHRSIHEEPIGHERAAHRATAFDTLELNAYVDPDFGFSVATPAGWRAVVAAESDAQMAMYEPGYALAFESPRDDDDLFADYLMVEILPGSESGLFETDGSRRRATRVDGRPAWRDELRLPMTVPAPIASAIAPDAGGSTPAGAREAEVELAIYQASFAGLGFTVSLYAIGEGSRGDFMAGAFEIMLRTFRLGDEPFEVS